MLAWFLGIFFINLICLGIELPHLHAFVCAFGFRRFGVTAVAVMVLPSGRLIGWEGFMSVFALGNERKEGEPIQCMHSVNGGTFAGPAFVCACTCVSGVTA